MCSGKISNKNVSLHKQLPLIIDFSRTGTVMHYGSGSAKAKVTAPAVPVPVKILEVIFWRAGGFSCSFDVLRINVLNFFYLKNTVQNGIKL